MKEAPRSGIVALGLGQAVEFAVLVHLLVQVWPAVQVVTAADATPTEPERATVSLFSGSLDWTLSAEAALVVVVLTVGALGAWVHAATSFTQHLGKSTYDTTWTWWYVLRAPVGAALALLLYFVVRGGLVSVSSDTESVNAFGIAAFAGLAGLFSTPATRKLAAIFDAALGPAKEAAAAGPVIADLAPDVVAVGAADTVTVTGTGFAAGVTLTVDGQERRVRRVSDKKLTFTLDAADVAAAGTRKVVVTAKGRSSAAASLVVR